MGEVPPVFGLIVSGRLVQTDFQQIRDDHFLFHLPDIESVKHVVVFLTGQLPLPIDMAAGVYFAFPDSVPAWIYLGYICNNKPSAVFRISGLKPGMPAESHPFGTGDAYGSHTNGMIGLAVMPMNEVAQLTADQNSLMPTKSNFELFTHRMLENLVNYASSFSLTQSQMMPSSDSYIPVKVIQQWYQNFKRRLDENPNFWK